VRIVAIGDVHCRVGMDDLIPQLVDELNGNFDVMVLAGDLTDHGLPEEAEVLADQLAQCDVPVISILGNHDHESGQAETVAQVLKDSGITVLDGTVCEVGEVGFVGTKGFCGGFGELMIAKRWYDTIKIVEE
jgi:uncharacterized protein